MGDPNRNPIAIRHEAVWSLSLLVIVLSVLSGCTFHPKGEREERAAATQEAKPFEKRWEEREIPPLPVNPSLEQIIRYALLSNAELEQRYWEWRSAIEQIPQDGTQPSNLVIGTGVSLLHGSPAWDRTTVTLGNDPMNDIVWPEKLSAAARRALGNARAAGQRFQKARFELRSKVVAAYYDYALNAKLIRLEESNERLLQTTVMASEARIGAGTSSQSDLLKARNELDLSRNDIASMRAQLPSQRAAINALLGRPPEAELPVPSALPPMKKITNSNEELIQLAARQNPELLAQAHEIEGRKEALHLARLQYYPDFSVAVGTDLSGVAQSLAGMVTMPLIRHEAIDAAIHQAEANLRAAEAMRRQAGADLATQLILDITVLRDADRQIALYEGMILPRARESAAITRSAYEAGQVSLIDFVDTQRLIIALQRLIVSLHATHEKRIADIEALSAG